MSKNNSNYHFLSDIPTFVQADDKHYRFHGLAYSGKSLRHQYWDNVVFDVSSTKSAAAKTPILIDHDPAKRAGFAELSFADNQIAITSGVVLDNEHGNQVINESKQGFPWQMSVHIDPARVERLQVGDTSTVNGHSVTGPAAIFRNSIIREVSFTATGVDYDTHALAMSHTPSTESLTMTEAEIQALKDQNVALTTSIDELKTSMQSVINAEKTRADTAENALNEHKYNVRTAAIKELFSVLGREFSDDAAKPYQAMDELMFNSIAADLKAVKPAVNAQLFSQVAIGGTDPDADTSAETPLKFTNIYEKRRVNNG